MNWISQPWPWYIAGPLIGLVVPALLLMGNKTFGISSSLRHICAACIPFGLKFFKYDWKKEIWNLIFVFGVFVGGVICILVIPNKADIIVAPKLAEDLASYGINDYSCVVPKQLFSWESLATLRGFILMVVGGFLVGFGTRYAGGCTSGHSISGLANFQLPSLIATCCFMAGGFLMANIILPFILSL